MTIQITTHRDVLRHTTRRVNVAVGLTIVMTAAITLLHLGTNLAAVVRVGDVIVLKPLRGHLDIGGAFRNHDLPVGAVDAGADADTQRTVAYLAD